MKPNLAPSRILAPDGKLRGYIREVGNRRELLNPGGRVLGYFDRDKNQTLRPGGILVSYGDTLTELLEN